MEQTDTAPGQEGDQTCEAMEEPQQGGLTGPGWYHSRNDVDACRPLVAAVTAWMRITQPGAASTDGAGLTMPASAQGLDPLLTHLLVLKQASRQSATEIDLTLIDQTTKTDRQSFLMALEATLAGGDPIDLLLCDHPRSHGFEEQLSECHLPCNEVVTLWQRLNADVAPRRSGVTLAWAFQARPMGCRMG